MAYDPPMPRTAILCSLIAILLVVGAGTTLAEQGGPTELITISSTGVQANSFGDLAKISDDGRYVVFQSEATNLVAGDNNGQRDVFIRDRQLGTTELVSISSIGTQGNGWSEEATISGDGRYIAFQSDATNLVAMDTNLATDIFLRDRVAGTSARLSVSVTGTQANNWSRQPSISADGNIIAFTSFASNLHPGDTSVGGDVYVRDVAAGSTELTSVSSAGVKGNFESGGAGSVSGDGRFVAFSSGASNLVSGDTNTDEDVFVRDRLSGTTERLSISTLGGQGNGNSGSPSISPDGSHVAFVSDADNLVVDDTNEVIDVFVRDRVIGATERASVSATDVQGNASSLETSISEGGRYVAFRSSSSNLIPGDTNGTLDIFVRDLTSDTVSRISVSSSGVQANQLSLSPDITADGRFVAFTSGATNFTPNDVGNWDVFVHERCLGRLDDLDADCNADVAASIHQAPANTNFSVDNCPSITNAFQANGDGNYLDHSPPYSQSIDDKTLPYSDATGDACDEDRDNDGLVDADEADGGTACAAITNPLLRDTDADRFLDGAECALGSDPTSSASKPLITACGSTSDADGDKLTERIEICFYGTDPNNNDTDGDKAFDGGKDGCEAVSLNHDRIVNVADMGMLASAISNIAFRVVSVDVNKDGVWNPADQGMVASFISPSGQCPG